MSEFQDYRVALSGQRWDLLIADIPWGYEKTGAMVSGTSNQAKKGAGAKLGHKTMQHIVPYETFQTMSDYVTMLQACKDALKLNRNLWVWSDWFTVQKLILANEMVGLKFFALNSMKRRNLGTGIFVRKQMLYILGFSRGRTFMNKGVTLPEFMGEYQITGSDKPQKVYDMLVEHSLPPGGTWLDVFPASHEKTIADAKGNLFIAPRLIQTTLMGAYDGGS